MSDTDKALDLLHAREKINELYDWLSQSPAGDQLDLAALDTAITELTNAIQRLAPRKPLESEYEAIASFTDTSTGYGITITSRLLPHPNRDKIAYMFGVHLPSGGASIDSPIETNPLRTDGTGLA